MNNTTSIFEALSTMCEVDEEEQLKAVLVILKGDELSYWYRNFEGCRTFEEVKKILHR